MEAFGQEDIGIALARCLGAAGRTNRRDWMARLTILCIYSQDIMSRR